MLERDGHDLLKRNEGLSILDVCDYYNLNFIGHGILGGMGYSTNLINVDRAIGPYSSLHARNLQLYKSGMQPYFFPKSVKGFAVGMS